MSEHGGPTPFRRLVRLLHLERDSLATVVLYAVAVGVVSLAAPLGVQALVSAIAFGGLRQPLFVLTLVVLCALGFAATLRALQWAVAERVQQRVFVRAALDVTHKLSHVRPSALDGAHPREFVNRFFDVVTIQKGAAALLVDGVYVVLQALVGACVLAFYHPLLLAYGAVLTVVVAVVLVPLGRLGGRTAIAESKAKYAVVAWFEEMASQTTAFRSRAGEAYAVGRARELTGSYLAARRAHFRIVFRQGVAFFAVQAIASAALLGVGGLLVLGGQITLGQLVAAELIVTAVTGAFAKFGKYLESYYDLLAAIDKVGHLIDVPVERIGGDDLPSSAVAVDVALAASELRLTIGGREVLSDVSLAIGPRDRLALFGANGAGKSALLDLLWGAEEPTSGTVLLSGVPLRELDLRRVRDEVALVRGVELFDGSIADNVRVGREDVDASRVREALETVGLWGEVVRLADGTSAPALRSGLSDGQIRRLLLARAIAGRPRVLLLDGVLDGIDTESRDAVASGVLAPSAPWAIVLATHDEGVAALANRTHPIVRGRVAAAPPTEVAS